MPAKAKPSAPSTPTPQPAAQPESRIWDSPVGTGEPVPFDPALHKPTLRPEDVDALLDGDGG